jgi:hypothetical protein
MSLEELKAKAIELGATDLKESKRAGKRYYVVYEGKRINFGSSSGKTYLDHKDDKKKENWRKRHMQIKNRDGVPFYTIKTSPSYWSYHILWP